MPAAEVDVSGNRASSRVRHSMSTRDLRSIYTETAPMFQLQQDHLHTMRVPFAGEKLAHAKRARRCERERERGRIPDGQQQE